MSMKSFASRRFRRMSGIAIGLGLTVTAFLLLGAASRDSLPKPGYNDKGQLLRPDVRYREWVYIGTPLTPNELNPPEAPFPEFHNVYIHPDDFRHWKATGTFPDGTMIIKELVTVGSNQAVSGKGYFMGEFVGLEVTVKDAKRFPDEPGYWAYFSFGHSYPLADAAEAFPTQACNSCHQVAAADDFVFTQYYPVLRAARGGGRRRVMDSSSPEFQQMSQAMGRSMEGALKPTAETGRVDSAVPADLDKLFAYLKAAKYKSLPAMESSRHSSRGPHSKLGRPVRVFMDAKMKASLAAGNLEHPAGSSIVKEMYTDDGQLEGWAVMVKTAEKSDGGQGWFWYENTSTKSGAKPVAAGNGVPLCFACHSTGKDFVLTHFPLQ